MIKAEDRAPLAKPASTVVSIPKAEPVRPVSFIMLELDKSTGTLKPFGSIELMSSDLEMLAETIEHYASTRPKLGVKLNTKPPTRLIITKVDPTHTDFVSRGGEPLVLGQVISTPDLVTYLKDPGSKLNASLIRYYMAQHKPFEHRGYTVRALDAFLHDLKGPATNDFQAVAMAHGAWAEENNETPFQ